MSELDAEMSPDEMFSFVVDVQKRRRLVLRRNEEQRVQQEHKAAHKRGSCDKPDLAEQDPEQFEQIYLLFFLPVSLKIIGH